MRKMLPMKTVYFAKTLMSLAVVSFLALNANAQQQPIFQINDTLNLISIEAESFAFSDPSATAYTWLEGTELEGYSGEAYISYDNFQTTGDVEKEGFYDVAEVLTQSAKVSYLIDFLDTGRYYLTFRVSVEDDEGTSDSFHYSTNGDSITNGTKIAGRGLTIDGGAVWKTPNVWQWWNTDDTRGRAYIDVEEEGLDTLEIYAREENLRLDKIILTKDVEYAPDTSVLAQSLGPDETLAPIKLSNSQAIARDMSVFPNPASQFANISYFLNDAEEVSLKVYNMAGKMVKELMNRSQSAGFHKLEWDTSNESLERGFYIIELKTQNAVERSRIFLKR